MVIYTVGETLISSYPLSDKNHISNVMLMSKEDRLKLTSMMYNFEIIEDDPTKSGVGEDHVITGWHDRSTMIEDKYIIYHLDDGTILWEPYIEQILRLKFFGGKKIADFCIGYVDGTMHHLGKYAPEGMLSTSNNRGYTLWIEKR